MVFVFLSYKSDDEKIAKAIKEAIEQRFSAKVFMSADARDGTTVGKSWPPEIFEAMQQSDIAILLISEKWINSPYCLDEFRLARYMGRTIVAVALEEKVQKFVQNSINDKTYIKWNELFDPKGKIKAENKLFSRLERIIKDSLFPPFEYRKGNPYKGLLAYQEDDAGVFFGREKERSELLKIMLAKKAKIYIIKGHSGVGKSSFMRAGILAWMRKFEKGWRVFSVYMPDLYDPLGSFAEYLALNTKQEINTIAHLLDGEDIDRLATLIKTTPEPLLIPIDQAEILVSDESNEAMKKVLRIYLGLIKKSSIFGMVTIRNDLFDKLQYYIDDKIKEVFELRSIAHNEIDNIIRLPLQIPSYRMRGYIIEDEFVRAVKEDIDYSADMLPLLSALLEKLFDEHKGKFTKEIYRKGDIKSHINDMAESIVEDITKEQRKALKDFLLFHLIRYVQATDSYILIQASLEAVPDEIQDVIDGFVQKRLLIKDKKSIKIVHESLLRHWSRLDSWVQENKEALHLLEEVDRYYEVFLQKLQEDSKNINDYLLPKSIVNEIETTHRDIIEISDKKEYIQQSLNFYKKERLKRRGFLVGSFAAIFTFAGFGYIQYFRARERFELARYNLGLVYAQRTELDAKDAERILVNLNGYKALKLMDPKYDTQRIRDDVKALLYYASIYYAPIKIEKIDKFPKRKRDIALTKFKKEILAHLKKQEQNKMLSFMNQIANIAESPDKQKLAVAFMSGNIIIYDLQSEKALKIQTKNLKRPTIIKFLSNKKILFDNFDTIKIWDIAKKREERFFQHKSRILDISILNGNKIVSSSWDRTVKIWDIRSGKLLQTLSFAPYVPVMLQNAHKNINVYLIHPYEPTKKFYVLLKKKNEKLLTIIENSPFGNVLFFPDGQKIASASGSTIKIWNSDTGLEIDTFHNSFDVFSLASSHDGEKIAAGCDGNMLRLTNNSYSIKIWDIATKKLLKTLRGHKNAVSSLAFSIDDKKLFSASFDKTIKIWDIESGNLIDTLQGHTREVTCVVCSSDGKRLASSSYDGNIIIWDIQSRKVFKKIKAHKDEIYRISFSPDGKLIASASSEKSIKVWDTKTGKLVRVLKGHKDGVLSVAFSMDGKKIISSSSDATIKMWDVDSGELLQTLIGHKGSVESVAFSPDGKRVASKCWADKTIRVWDITKFDDPHFIAQQIKKFENYLHNMKV